MDVLEAIKGRRSVRKFSQKAIPKEIILKILDAARYAPSAGNLQDWKFIVVRGREKIKEIAGIALNQRWLENASFLVIACSDLREISKYGERGIRLYSKHDVAASIQNMLLYAWSLGIGSCWVGAFDEEKLKEYLNLPKHLEPQAILAFGYPAEIPPMPTRKNLAEIVVFAD